MKKDHNNLRAYTDQENVNTRKTMSENKEE